MLFYFAALNFQAMRYKISFIGILLVGGILLSPASQAQDSTKVALSFPEAWVQVCNNSHVLKQNGLLIQEKEAERKARTGLRMPHVSLSAQAIQMADPLELDLTPVRDAINPLYSALGNYGVFSGVPNPDPATTTAMPVLPDAISTQVVRGKILEGQKTINEAEWVKTIQKDRFAALNASVIWPLYTGGKINAAIKASELEKEEAGINGEIKQSELLSELVERYYGLSLAQQAVKVRAKVLETMQKHLYDAQKLSEQGQIAKVQFLHAQVAVTDAEREMKKAKREMQIIERALQNTLTIEESKSLMTLSPLFFSRKVEDEAWFIQLALQHNPHLKLVASKKELAGVGVQLEKSNFLPTVALTGTYDLANKDLSPYMPEWMVGMGMRWTVFEGNARNKKLQAARFKEGQVEQIGLKAQEDIFTGIRKFHQELQMQVEQIDGLAKTLEFAETYRDSQQKAFSEGLASSADLVDANLLVAKVKIDRLQAMYRYDVSLARLLQLCGSTNLFANYQNSDQTVNESIN